MKGCSRQKAKILGVSQKALTAVVVRVETSPVSRRSRRWITASEMHSSPRSIAINTDAPLQETALGQTMDSKAAIGPAGGFSVMRSPARKYLFISADSRIRPIMPMTIWLHDPRHRLKGLEHVASRVEGIDLKWVVEQTGRYQPWTSYRGISAS